MWASKELQTQFQQLLNTLGLILSYPYDWTRTGRVEYVEFKLYDHKSRRRWLQGTYIWLYMIVKAPVSAAFNTSQSPENSAIIFAIASQCKRHQWQSEKCNEKQKKVLDNYKLIGVPSKAIWNTGCQKCKRLFKPQVWLLPNKLASDWIYHGIASYAIYAS